MADEQDRPRLCRNISGFIPVLIFLSIIGIILWQIQEPATDYQYKRLSAYKSLFPHLKEFSPDEKRIAKHFAADTLPGLMNRGLICGYLRNASGTSIAVNGRLWRKRSQFFKTSLLTEVSVFNKIQGYELSTKIINNISGKLYACASPPAKMDFFD